MKDEKVLSIDVEGVLRERLPRLCRFIPSGVFRWLERTICQEQLNGLLAANAGKRKALSSAAVCSNTLGGGLYGEPSGAYAVSGESACDVCLEPSARCS